MTTPCKEIEHGKEKKMNAIVSNSAEQRHCQAASLCSANFIGAKSVQPNKAKL